MSCPDWHALVERRATDPNGEREWRSALCHLDECSACQAEALAHEPTLMFRRLPSLEAGRDEIEAMKQAVASMRRGQVIENRRNSTSRPLLQAAAVAAVLLGALLLRGTGTPSAEIVPVVAGAQTQSAGALDLQRMPLIETADPNYGSIIQVVDDDISVVLVVPQKLDV